MTPVSATITRALAHTQPIQGTHTGASVGLKKQPRGAK